jgi:4-hydroxy-tetrahydrodipicolinate reductase
MPIKICLAGATGNVGSKLVIAISEADDLELAGAVAKTQIGKPLKAIIAESSADTVIKENVAEALTSDTDVLIDYTKPDAVFGNVMTAAQNGVHAVVGTSGLSDEEYENIDSEAKANGVGVLAAGNFSITATLMQHFALIAAKLIPYWEIFDYGPSTKKDSPSGTSRELAYQLAKVRKPKYDVPLDATFGLPESRGAELNHSQVHSIRLPGYYSAAAITFGAQSERLTLRHDSMSPLPYVSGTLLAARKVGQFSGLKRGLATILEL